MKNRLNYLLAVVFSFTLLTSCATLPTARERFKSVKNYMAYYYAHDFGDRLMAFDLALVQPDTLTDRQIQDRLSAGKFTLVHLSLGEAEPGSAWFRSGQVETAWLLGRNETWGTQYVDARQAGWQKLVVDLAGQYLARGFDGLLLDAVDTGTLFPETQPGLVALIKLLRQTYPGAVLVQNRGLAMVDEVASDLDGLLLENLTTQCDFSNNDCVYMEDPAALADAAAAGQSAGLVRFSLDFAPLDNSAVAYQATAKARQLGFIPVVTTLYLDTLPDYGLEKGGPADIRARSVTLEYEDEKPILVATFDNAGLSPAAGVNLELDSAGKKLAETKHDFAIGEQFVWRAEWAKAINSAVVYSMVWDTDANTDNNLLAWRVTGAALADEPLLPYDQQRHRPPENGTDMVATALTQPLQIDGDLSEWASMPCTTIDKAEQALFGNLAGWSGPADLSARVCFAWGTDNLYVGMEVMDDIIVQTKRSTDLWRGDHIELWLDTQLQTDFDSDTFTEDDFQLGFSPGDFDKVEPDFYIWTPPLKPTEYINVVEYASQRTATGYAAEFRFPAYILSGLRLATDHTIGAAFQPSDTDTPGGSSQELMMSNAPQSTLKWGIATVWSNLTFRGVPTVK